MNKQKKIFSFLLVIYWIFLWASINTIPNDIVNFGKSFTESINAIRIFIALTLSVLIILYFFFIFFFREIKITKINIFFFLFFTSQVLGVYLNEERNFDIHNLYLAILAIGTVCLFMFLDYFRINYLTKYLLLIALFFLSIALIFFVSLKFNEIKNFNFYVAFQNHETNSFNQVNPRITGLSRMLALINLFIILYFFSFKNFYLRKFIIFFATIVSIILFFMESRGTLICYFLSLTYIILFLLNKNIKSRIKYFLLLVILPASLYFFINSNSYQIKNQESKKNEITNSNNRILSFSSSGRYEIYSYTFKNYDYKKIFGYGSNGDRYFLKNFGKKNKYGDNTSNIFLYSLVSGGFIAMLFIILIFYEILKIFIQNQRKIQNQTEKNGQNFIYIKFSITCLIFFFIRSFFENSFGLFSVDFLMTYLSITYIIIWTNKSKIL